MTTVLQVLTMGYPKEVLDMTAKDFLLTLGGVHQKANIIQDEGVTTIIIDPKLISFGEEKQIVGMGLTEDEAWEDALFTYFQQRNC